MQKLTASLVGFALIVTAITPGFASAQTSLEANLNLIQTLTNQIKALQEQIKALQQQQAQIQTTANQAIVEIIQGLKEGSKGDQVTLLQTLLAADASLYPEGLVTGFFGPMTRRALQRFQSRNSLESVGFVGPRTREALNKWIREQFKIAEKIEDDIADEVENAIGSIVLPPLPSDPCTVPGLPLSSPIHQRDGKSKLIQTGNVFIYQDGKHKIIITPNTYIEKDGKKQLLITPGMRIEKDGKSKTIIPCNGATTTPISNNDTTPPTLSAIQSAASHQSATITWITNEAATGKVYYGTSTPLNLGTAKTSSHSSFQTGHSFTLTGLNATTTYYFIVESKDKKGNTATSSQQSFTTNAPPADVTAPIISAIVATPASTTAQVTWTTNEAATSKVYYGTVTPLVLGSASTVSAGAFVTSHALGLSSLATSTTYYMVVESKDASNNTALATEVSFVTGN